MSITREIARLSASSNHPDLPGPELLPSRLMRAAAQVLPVAGCGISAFTRYRHRVPLGASDEDAALAERLQFTVGEGPCLQAYSHLAPVMASAAQMGSAWPAFHSELVVRTPYRSILSIPIVEQGLMQEAAMDFYFTETDRTLDRPERHAVDAAVDVVVALLAAGSGLNDPHVPGPVWLNNASVDARALVWTAAGMIDVAMDLATPDALAILRGYAYSHRRTVDEIAHSLVTGALPVESLKYKERHRPPEGRNASPLIALKMDVLAAASVESSTRSAPPPLGNEGWGAIFVQGGASRCIRVVSD